MAPSGHALLGPSSAHRWMHCTPSAVLESHFPSTTSKYAEEGTLAHAIVEERLGRVIKGKPRGTTSARLKKKEHYKPEMDDYCDEYVTMVTEIFDDLTKQGRHPVMYSESKVDFSEWVENGYGTCDTSIIADDTLYIFDFKYGANVKVEAKDNPQLRLYALGAYNEFSTIYDIDTIIMYIVQPRVTDGVSMDTVSTEDLLNWAETEVRPKALDASTGTGKCIEGDWCQFCRAKTVCKARTLRFIETLKLTETSARLMSEEDLAVLLPYAEYLTGWAKEVKDWMLDQAVNAGAQYPGYKLVQGRSNRVILNENALAEKLKKAGYTDIYSLKGITDLEGIVGKTKFAELAGGLVDKPAGKPTLVVESDPRPAIGDNRTNMFDDGFEEEKQNG